jgi:Kef-type K+ transport system membrane component KefB
MLQEQTIPKRGSTSSSSVPPQHRRTEGVLRQRTQSSIAISHASIVAPFLMVGALALWLYPRYATPGVSFTLFALFLGVAMSVTAFPVLARILTDRGMQTSPIGVLALGCAAVDDVTAWCLLGFVVAVAHAGPRNPLLILAMTVAFILFVLLVAKRGHDGLFASERRKAEPRGIFSRWYARHCCWPL